MIRTILSSAISTCFLSTAGFAQGDILLGSLVDFLERNECRGTKSDLEDVLYSGGFDVDLLHTAVSQLIGTGHVVLDEDGVYITLRVGDICDQIDIDFAPIDAAVLAELISIYEENSCIIELDSGPLKNFEARHSSKAFNNTMSYLLNNNQLEVFEQSGDYLSQYTGGTQCNL